uniref:7TM_GPCR_Srx domain-containing protein n=1 Tax=Strongyloides stercoralis TaxID=6248 RepID=A0A0K0ERV4_STRER
MPFNPDYISLAYTIVLLPFYTIYTIRLGYMIYIKKSPDVRNEYYPIIFFKGCIDNITNIVQFSCARILKYHILEDFFLTYDFPVYILYFTTGATYVIMMQITFVIAFNRFIAITKPFLYKQYFEFKRLHFYLALTFIPGATVAIFSVCYELDYVWYPALNRVMPGYLGRGVEYLQAGVGIVFNFPMAVVTTIMNIKCVFKNKDVLSAKNLKSSVESKLFLYNVLSFITMIGFEFYYICRYLPYIIGKFPYLETISIAIIPWFLDVMTYGLFLFSLALSSVLRSYVPICGSYLSGKKKKKTTKVALSQQVTAKK